MPSSWLTGIAEILGGIGILLPPVRKAAAIGLAAYAIGVYPANVYQALWHVSGAAAARQLVVPRAAARGAAAVRLVGAVRRRSDRLAVRARLRGRRGAIQFRSRFVARFSLTHVFSGPVRLVWRLAASARCRIDGVGI